MIKIKKFSAEWCQPCKKYGPILDRVVSERSDVELELVDIDTDPKEAARYGVQGVPFTVFEREGEILGGFQGAVAAAEVNRLIDSLK